MRKLVLSAYIMLAFFGFFSLSGCAEASGSGEIETYALLAPEITSTSVSEDWISFTISIPEQGYLHDIIDQLEASPNSIATTNVGKIVIRRTILPVDSVTPQSENDDTLSFDFLGKTFVDENVTAGITFEYEVEVESPYGQTSPKTGVLLTAQDVDPPSSLIGLVFETGEGQVNLSWSESPTDGEVVIHRSQSPLGSIDDPAEGIPINGDQATDTGLTPGETYYYLIYTQDDSGNVSTPDSYAITVPPASPSAISSDVPSQGTLSLSWDSPVGVYSQVVVKQSNQPIESSSDGSILFVSSSESGVSSYVHTGVQRDATLYYGFYSQGTDGQESDVVTIQETMTDTFPPEAPSLSLSSAFEEITVSWVPPSDSDVALIEVRTGSSPIVSTADGTQLVSYQAPFSVFETVHTGVTNGQNYHYTVFASDSDGNTSSSNSLFVAPNRAALASTALPKFQGDNALTGRSVYSGPSVTPSEYWGYTDGGNPSIGQDDRVVYGTSTGVSARDANGNLLWEFNGGAQVLGVPLIDENGVVYAGTADGRIYAIRSQGTQKWQYTTGSGAAIAYVALGTDGALYASDFAGSVYALNQAGDLSWTYNTGSGSLVSAPAVDDNGWLYVASGTEVFALNQSGGLEWSYTCATTLRRGVIIHPNGNLYVADHDATLYAINAASGALSFSNQIYSDLKIDYSMALDQDDNLVVGGAKSPSYSGAMIFGIDPANGDPLWHFDTNHFNWDYDSSLYEYMAGPLRVDDDNCVYVPMSSGHIVAIDIQSVDSSQVISIGGDDVYSRHERWVYDANGSSIYSVNIGSDGAIYSRYWSSGQNSIMKVR